MRLSILCMRLSILCMKFLILSILCMRLSILLCNVQYLIIQHLIGNLFIQHLIGNLFIQYLIGNLIIQYLIIQHLFMEYTVAICEQCLQEWICISSSGSVICNAFIVFITNFYNDFYSKRLTISNIWYFSHFIIISVSFTMK